MFLGVLSQHDLRGFERGSQPRHLLPCRWPAAGLERGEFADHLSERSIRNFYGKQWKLREFCEEGHNCFYRMRRTLILFSVIAWTSLIAHLRADSVTLAWDANTDLVSGYRIFAGQASRTYVLTNEIGPFLTGTFTNLANGIWYFSVTAHLDVGTNRLESGFSDEIS